MTAKRKAELQRKLALAPVPKPPVDLADRIKGEIPKHLAVDAEKERVRLRQAVAFNVRVAASILLLVSSVYLALHLLSRKFGAQETASMASAPAANVETAPAGPVQLPTAPPSQEAVAAKAQKQNDRKQIVVAHARPEPIVTRTTAEETGGSADSLSAAAESPPVAPPAAVAAPLPAPAADNEALHESLRAAPASKPMTATFDLEASG